MEETIRRGKKLKKRKEKGPPRRFNGYRYANSCNRWEWARLRHLPLFVMRFVMRVGGSQFCLSNHFLRPEAVVCIPWNI